MTLSDIGAAGWLPLSRQPPGGARRGLVSRLTGGALRFVIPLPAHRRLVVDPVAQVRPPRGGRPRVPLRLAVACVVIVVVAAALGQDPGAPDTAIQPPTRPGEGFELRPPEGIVGELSAKPGVVQAPPHDSADQPGASSPQSSPQQARDTPTGIDEPVRIEVPAIGVDAKLVGVGLKDDGSMAVPDFGLAGWYTKGPAPGAPGPAVIAAHVDSYKGPDVFFRLRELEPGDEIHVRDADGRTLTWRTESTELVPKDELPTQRIWNDTDEPVLRLITCGGQFDRSARSYKSNMIVYASPVQH